MYVVSTSLFGQRERIDSLETAIENHIASQPEIFKDSTYVDLLLALASEYEFTKPDSLLLLTKKAMAISNEMGFTQGKQKAQVLMGYYFSDMGRHKQALVHFERALGYVRLLNDASSQVDILNDIGLEYAYSGNFEEALKSYLHALDVVDPIKEDNMVSLAILNENIAHLYQRQNEPKTALAFYEKAKKINDQIGDEVNSAMSMVNHAEVLSKTGDHQTAMYQINKSITTFEKEKIYEWLASTYTVKGNIYLNQKKYKWAIYWFEQGAILHKDLKDDRSRLQLFNSMSQAYLGMQMDSLANKYATKGFEIATHIKSLEGIANSSKTLYTINNKKNNYEEALKFHEIYHKISDSISQDKNKKGLALFKTKLKYDQQKKDLMVQNEKELAKQRTYFYVAAGILGILLTTLIPLYFNQKRQKKLNIELKEITKNLKQRESELNGINRTKDKLFSIIGHDLRGPIGALQGILNLFSSGDMSKDGFLAFVPKLKTDVDHTLFTLNNLLSWGHGQMNGTRTRPKITALDHLVENNINLLSELAANKSIKINNELPERLMGYTDEDQIDIVFRNLISNAIKFTPKNGMITIGTEEMSDQWKIMINDTGVGMDTEVLQKIFKENTNMSTYGTDNEKGTGLGLALCHEMVINNGGKIWVESLLGSGSTFYFTVPKVEKKYREAS